MDFFCYFGLLWLLLNFLDDGFDRLLLFELSSNLLGLILTIEKMVNQTTCEYNQVKLYLSRKPAILIILHRNANWPLL